MGDGRPEPLVLNSFLAKRPFALVAATAVLAGGSQAVAAQPLSQAKTVSAHGDTLAGALDRVSLTTVIDQWTHYTPDSKTSSHAGTLYRGTGYFSCYTAGEVYTNNGRTSGWWLVPRRPPPAATR
ncbi:hypothetical protein ABZT03_07200 [Streptomyces sp. NPDC005574]|uniref:hypothetical protein n=1 Tax=Streptomyces sp. NPDC005574 TaxID=3156891 RepID=UPI0033AB3F4F